MLIFITIVHVLLCVFMIFVILLQPGKDAGMGSALGGGAATSAFGGRGAVTFLSKLTAICAGLFFITSLGLSFVGIRASVAAVGVDEMTTPAPTNAPAPAAGPGSSEGTSPAAPADQATPAAPAAAGPNSNQESSAAPATDSAKKTESSPPAPAPSQKKPRSSKRR
jgi:preprotein translocase subunit SecG